MSLTRQQWIAYSKLPLFVLLAAPAVWLSYQAFFAPQLLGADPAKSLLDQTGIWAIRMILLALAVTPLRILTRQNYLIQYRRMTGLFAFFYTSLHFLVYSVLLLELDITQISIEVTQRPYIVVGFIALLLYIPLAVTSTKGWQRRLKRNWVKLHKLVYLIGILAVVHMTWLKKVGLYDTWPYALLLIVLLGIRIVHHYRQKKPNTTRRTHPIHP